MKDTMKAVVKQQGATEMTDISPDYAKVRNPLPGEICHINWAEDGGAEVVSYGDHLLLYSVPQYGGEPRLEGRYRFDEFGTEALLTEANSWI